MTVELDNEQLELLQDILVHMISKTDWSNTISGEFLEAHVLMEFDKDIASKVNEIYDKLF